MRRSWGEWKKRGENRLERKACGAKKVREKGYTLFKPTHLVGRIGSEKNSKLRSRGKGGNRI